MLAGAILLDEDNENYTDSKGKNDYIIMSNGVHTIIPGKGKDEISVNYSDGQDEDIKDSTIQIGPGSGNTTIRLGYQMMNWIDEHEGQGVYLPQIVFDGDPNISYKMVSSNSKDFFAYREAETKYNTACIEALLKGKDPGDVPAPDILEVQLRFDLVITASWDKKTSTVTVADYFTAGSGLMNNVTVQPYFNNNSFRVMTDEITSYVANHITGSSNYGDFENKLAIEGLDMPSSYYSAQEKYMNAQYKWQLKNALDGVTDKDAIEHIKIQFAQQKKAMQEGLKVYKGIKANFEGTNYDDYIDASKKSGYILAGDGDNYIVTAKNGFTYVSSGDGDDIYHISSIKNATFIQDKGNSQFNDFFIDNANGNDIHLELLSVDDGTTLDTLSSITITDSSGVNALKNLSMTNPGSMILNPKIIATSKIKGVTICGDEAPVIGNNGVITLGSGGTDLKIEGKFEKGAGYIAVEDLNFVADKLLNRVKSWLGNNDLNSVSELFTEYSEDAINTQMKHALVGVPANEQKEIKAYFNNIKRTAENLRKEYVDMINSYYIGTDGNNKYTVGKDGAVIASGYGSDTFTFKGKIADSGNMTEIKSHTDYDETDKIVISNYTFDDGNLYFSGLKAASALFNNGLYMTAIDRDKTGHINSSYGIIYDNFYDEGQNLIIKDKNREYVVSYTEDTYNFNYSEDKSNHINLLGNTGSETGTIYITSNNKYNRIYSQEAGKLDYTYGGGHDYLSTNYAKNDSFRIEDFNKKTSLVINDSAAAHNDADNLSINAQGKDLANMRVIFNYDKTNGADFSNMFILNKSNIKASNFYRYNDMLLSQSWAAKSGITANGVENVYLNYSAFIQYNDGEYSVDSDYQGWIDELNYQLASWMNNHEGYNSTMDVFNNGSNKDIASLLKVYQSVGLDEPVRL